MRTQRDLMDTLFLLKEKDINAINNFDSQLYSEEQIKELKHNLKDIPNIDLDDKDNNSSISDE